MAGIMFDAEVQLGIDTKLDDIRHLLQAQARQERRTPRYLKLPFQFVANASASQFNAVDLGGPNQGRHWFINRFVADQQLSGATRPTIGGIYLGTGPQGQVGVRIFGFATTVPFFTTLVLEYSDATLPATENWGREQFVLHYPEHLYVLEIQPSTTPTALGIQGNVQVTDVAEHEDPRYTLNEPQSA